MAKRKAKKAKNKPATTKKAPSKKKKASAAAPKGSAKSKVKKAKASKPTGKKAKTAKPAAKTSALKKRPKPVLTAKSPAKKKSKSVATPAAKKPATKTSKPTGKTAKPGGTKLMIPPPLLNSDYLPLWFGGDGLTSCFRKLGVATIGELRTKTEEDVLKAGGTSALVRIKARIERIEERALAPKLEPPALGAAPPMSETFAYFLKPSQVEHAIGASGGRSQICDIVHRPNSTQVTVRLSGGREALPAYEDEPELVRPVTGGWRDVTVPLDQLELVSRDHRREELEDATLEEIEELLSIYKLKGTEPVVRIDAILDYEFSTFGREW